MAKFTNQFLASCKELKDHIDSGNYTDEHFAGLVDRYLGKFLKGRDDAYTEVPSPSTPTDRNPKPDLSPPAANAFGIFVDLMRRGPRPTSNAIKREVHHILGRFLNPVTFATPTEAGQDHIDLGMGDIVSGRDIRKWREHSIQLNEMVWWMAVQLGDVQPDEVTAEVDIEKTFEKFRAHYKAPAATDQGEIARLTESKRKWKKKAKESAARIERLHAYDTKMKEQAGYTDTASMDDIWQELIARAGILKKACDLLADGVTPENFLTHFSYRLYASNPQSGVQMIPKTLLDAAVSKVQETGRSLETYAKTLKEYSAGKK